MGNLCAGNYTIDDVRSLYITKRDWDVDKERSPFYNEGDLEVSLKELCKSGGHEQYFMKALILGSDCVVKMEKGGRTYHTRNRMDKLMVMTADKCGVVLTDYKENEGIKEINLARTVELWKEILVIMPSKKIVGRKLKNEEEEEEEEEEGEGEEEEKKKKKKLSPLQKLRTENIRPTKILQRLNKDGEVFGDVYICLTGSRDEVIPKIIIEDDDDEGKQETMKRLGEFIEKNSELLEPLYVAYKRVKQEQWDEILKNLTEAEESNKVEARQEVYCEIEKDLTLLGCVEFVEPSD